MNMRLMDDGFAKFLLGEYTTPRNETLEELAVSIEASLTRMKTLLMQDVSKARHMRFDDNGTYGWSRWMSMCTRHLESMNSIVKK